MGHFVRECRVPRSKEGQFENQDNIKKQGNNEDTSSKAMLVIDGVGFDWSDMAEETCFRQTWLKWRFQTQSEFEKVKQEKKGIEFKIEKFDKASKDLDKLLESQITDKSKKGLGYSVVPPPHPLIYNRPKKLDLSYSGLDEFKEPEFKGYGSEDSKKESNVVCDKKSDDSKENSDNSLVKEQVSKDTSSFVESSLNVDKETVFLLIKSTMNFNTARPQAVNTTRPKVVKTARPNSAVVNVVKDDTGFVDSGCSRHMTRNIAYLSDFKEFDGGYVTFWGGAHGGRTYEKKATSDESMLWHRRLGHINFKNINKLVKDNIVRGLPTKCFENDQTCVACLKGKQHRASCKSKDETSEILKNFIKEIENLVDKKVKIIRSDNGTEFKNKVMDDFCREKGIKREYMLARTPQQNGVAERRNRTLIEVARTMLDDSKLPTTFWAEAVSTACYVQNRVLVVKPHNKTPYELFRGFKPALSFMRPFGCHVTILNTLDNLGKFDGKSDEGFFVGYSLSSKAFRVYNTRTRRVEENLHIGFLENKPMIEGNGPKWLFDIDSLTQSMNYVPVAASTIINEFVGTQEELNADSDDVSSPKEVNVAGQHVNTASPNVTTGSFKLNVVGPSVNTASSYDQDSPKDMFTMGASHTLKATHVEFFSDEDEPEVDLGNIINSYTVPNTPNTRIHKDHPIENVIGDVKSTVQTRRMIKPTSEQGFLSAVYEQNTHDTLNTYLYASFLSQIEPTSIAKALSDSSWVEAMQKELLQFKLQQDFKDLPSRQSLQGGQGTLWVASSTKSMCKKQTVVATSTTEAEYVAAASCCSGFKCQDTILGDVDAQTRFETTSKQSNDPPLSRG
ncbi:putative ribonuclease H-like domain-containing protein [Tanacetum coccineum]